MKIAKIKFLEKIILTPYWQILENSSRNFSEIFIFRVVTQAWETHALKIMSTYSVFFNSWASHRHCLSDSFTAKLYTVVVTIVV